MKATVKLNFAFEMKGKCSLVTDSVLMLSAVSRKVIRSMTEMMPAGKTSGCPLDSKDSRAVPAFLFLRRAHGELPEDLRSSVLVKILK